MSKVYRGLQGQDIDLSRVCPCLTDELSNGMIDYMKRASLAIRGVRFRYTMSNFVYCMSKKPDSLYIVREAAKKLFFLVAWPLRPSNMFYLRLGTV